MYIYLYILCMATENFLDLCQLHINTNVCVHIYAGVIKYLCPHHLYNAILVNVDDLKNAHYFNSINSTAAALY